MKINNNSLNIAKIISDEIRQHLDLLAGKFFKNRIEWLTTTEAAEYLRISENNLRVKVSRGEIEVHGRLGSRWRFRRDKLEELLNSPDKGVFND